MHKSKRLGRQKSLRLEHLEPRQMLTAVCSSGRDDFTVGLVACESTAYEGYTLLTSDASREAHLLDIHGRYVNSWDNAPFPGRRGARLGPDGSLYSSGTIPNPAQIGGGVTGALYIQDWDGNVTWNFNYSNSTRTLHHDIEVMPNGNVLAFAWVEHSAADLIALGRDPAEIPNGELWGERIVELEPTGLNTANVVWEWNVIDHLIQDFDSTKSNFGVVADHPERLDINLGAQGNSSDWVHFNAIDYNPELDQILVNSPFLQEFYIIDHSTTTAEAATSSGGTSGMGGDFLYRWGNPGNYDAPGSPQLFNQHDAQWIDNGSPGAGNFLVFNNLAQPNSLVFEITPPAIDATGNYAYTPGMAYEPTAPGTVIDTGETAVFISGTQRMPNGNTMFIHGPDGFIVELDPAGNQVWEYLNPVTPGGGVSDQGDMPAGNNMFKSRRYAPDFSGFDGRDLSPQGYVEDWVLGDYDLDNTVSGPDLDLFCSGLTSGDHIYDLNFDDLLNTADVEAFAASFGLLMGDANQDGFVDVSDFNIWNANEFQLGSWGDGDFNCDGGVDVSDFNIWNDNKFSSVDELAAFAIADSTKWMMNDTDHEQNDSRQKTNPVKADAILRQHLRTVESSRTTGRSRMEK